MGTILLQDDAVRVEKCGGDLLAPSQQDLQEIGRSIISNPDGVIAKYALSFNFYAMNNVAEYEVLIMGLKIIKELDIDEVKVFFNFQSVVSQVLGEYEVKDPTMAKYLQRIKDLSRGFKKLDVQRDRKSVV